MKSPLKNSNESHSQVAVTRGGARLGSANGVQAQPLTQGAESSAEIDSAPRVALQRKQLHAAFGHAIQRQAGPEEEELLQGKLNTVQRQGPEEEELLQGKFDPVQRQGALEEEEVLQGKLESVQRQDLEDEELLQGKFAPRETPAQVRAEDGRRGNDTGLADNLRAGIEHLSGISMDDVKVHYNSTQPAQLNALAYAQGTDIHVAPGQEQHLPHEAWHVVQRAQGRVKPTMQMKDGVPVNDDQGLEREADVMGQKATQLKREPKIPPQPRAFMSKRVVQRTPEAQKAREDELDKLSFDATAYEKWISTVKTEADLTDVERINLFGKCESIYDKKSETGDQGIPTQEDTANALAIWNLMDEFRGFTESLELKRGERIAWAPSGIGPAPGGEDWTGGRLTMWAEGGGKQGARQNMFYDWVLGRADDGDVREGMNCWEFVLFCAINDGRLTKKAVFEWYQDALKQNDTHAAVAVLKAHMTAPDGDGEDILTQDKGSQSWAFSREPDPGELVIAGELDHVAIGVAGGKVLSLGHGADESNFMTLTGTFDPISLGEAFGRYLEDKAKGAWIGTIEIYRKSWKD